MSASKYILIYPFETRDKAFEVANDIDGSLMWQAGKAYPIDGVAAEIVPISSFTHSKDKELEQQKAITEAAKFLLEVKRYQYASGKGAKYQALMPMAWKKLEEAVAKSKEN